MFFVEEVVFEEYKVVVGVVSVNGFELDVVGAEDGAVAVEFEDAHAVLYYVRMRRRGRH